MESLFYVIIFALVYTSSGINPKLLEIESNKLSDVMKEFIIRVIQENYQEKDGFLFSIINQVETEFSYFAIQKLSENATVIIINFNLNRYTKPLMNPNHLKFILANPNGELSHAKNIFKRIRAPRAKIVLILIREPMPLLLNYLLSSYWKIKCINVIIVYESDGKIKVITYNPYLPTSKKIENLGNSTKDLFYDKTKNLYGTKIKCLLTYLDRTKIKKIQTTSGLHYEGKDYMAIQTLISKLNGTMELITMDSVLLNPWFESIIVDNRTVRKKKTLDNRDISLLVKSERFTTDDEALDNLYPHAQNDLSSLAPKSLEISVARSVMMMYASGMYIANIFITIVILLLWIAVKKFYRNTVNIPELYFDICRIIVTNNIAFFPQKFFERIIIIFWILNCFLINTFMQSKITSFLAIRQYYPEINTIEELFTSGLPLYSMNIYIEEIEKKYAGTPYESYAKSLIPLGSNEGWLDQMTYRADVSKIPVFFTEYDLALFVSRCTCYRKNGVPVYHLVKESLIPSYQSYKVAHNSPLLPILDRNLRRLSEGGFIELWAKKVIFNATVEGFLSPENDENVRSTKPVTLEEIVTFFYILWSGYLLSGFSLIAEILIYKKAQSRIFPYVN